MPRSSLKFNQGDIVLLELPFTDYLGSKLRPVLVVSSDELNSISNDLVVLKITSKPHFKDFQVELVQSDLLQGKLKKRSFIDCSSVFTVEKSLVIKRIAKLTPKKLQEVKNILKRTFGID
ncbi:type II toxin-antitoxin system PemK/MazF family toxin [Thermococcus thioreducens]|uniref:MazF family transcriptional regulator n=1 Tax=Thermococcus thioreducens TaxID=277988 RepID=A0A0Q2RF57_9EURY|nr:type II toxin-antitoxin system PemK/MazF family toxin [Thermococcus thioreducens]ASJ11615.1 MazF family transcriptional regulator [Thermococcus thioreducens]KQH82646.1 MazF family transcriptional regulator [Thermococcus thioreducens]SEW16865.1 mRNA interferase MazF [Thermococcus thioreducens]